MTFLSKNRAALLATSAALLSALSPIAASASELVGTVVDGSNTRTLQGAQIRILELGRSTETGRGGNFRFSDLPAGTYTLEARYQGADTKRETITIGAAGTIATANILLGGQDAILVIGQGANLSSSLSRQRAADGIESVLTRDAIGQFPDQNVAESIRRLSGVNVLNDQGEGRYVSVRGLDPELNAASINGIRLPSPETDSRSVGLDVVAAELIESIEVKKSLTPDMDADTLGATIEIKTTSAFDRKKDLLSVKLEGSYNDYADHVSPKASLDFSTRLSDNFGIAGGFTYQRRKFESDNMEAADWAISDDGIVYAEELQYRDYDVTRERIGGSLNLDFRASDSTKLYARGLYSKLTDQEYRGDVIFIMSGAPDAANSSGDRIQFSDEDGRIEVRRRMKDRFEDQRIKSISIGGETETGPWKAKYNLAYSEASESKTGSVDPTRFRNRFNDDGLIVDFDYSNPRVPTYNIVGNQDSFYDPTTYGFNELEYTVFSSSKDKEWNASADLAREFALSNGSLTVQGGIKSRWRTKNFDLDSLVYEGYDGDYTLADVLGGQTYRLQDLLPLPSHNGPSDFFHQNRDKFELDILGTAIDSASSDYSVDEDILAAYLLGRFDNSVLRVIGGLRMERTKNDINGFIVQSDGDGATVDPVNFRRSYTDWLPSLAIRYEAAPDVVLRFGGSKSLVRPKLSNLAPRMTLDEDLEAVFGNPNLKPYSAWNLDLSAEYYFGKNSAITAGVFWKSIKDFIVEYRDGEQGTAYGVNYVRATSYQNGDTAKVKGVEVSFAHQFRDLPSPWDGFLVNANYTYTDASGAVFNGGDRNDPRDISLPASSKHTFNASLGYEKGPISLRLAGTYRDKYLDEIGSAPDQDRYVDDHFQLDLSAKYKLTDKVRLFAEWVNITDAPYYAYQNFAGAKRLMQYEKYSWTAKFGVSANF